MSDEKAPKVPVLAGNQIRAIIPDSLDGAFRLAQAFVQGGIAPRGMQRPEQVMIAILAGLEVGLRPLQAVQSIYVVNGRPQLFGDALVAVIRASGRCKYIREGIEGEGEGLRAWCETWRVGEEAPVRETFSWAQAKKAGLTGKPGPWSEYPARMLKTRARNFVLRDVYADVLRGLGNDLDEPTDVGNVSDSDPLAGTVGTSEADREPGVPTDDANPPESNDEPPDPDAEEPSETNTPDVSDAPDPDAESSSVEGLLELLTTQLKAATDPQMVDDVWNDLEVEASLTHDEDALAMASSLKERRLKQLARKK